MPVLPLPGMTTRMHAAEDNQRIAAQHEINRVWKSLQQSSPDLAMHHGVSCWGGADRFEASVDLIDEPDTETKDTILVPLCGAADFEPGNSTEDEGETSGTASMPLLVLQPTENVLLGRVPRSSVFRIGFEVGEAKIELSTLRIG